MTAILEGRIAQEVRDEIPETWEALRISSNFGQEALVRRLERVQNKLFNRVLSEEEVGELDSMVLEYVAKKTVIELIRPGVDYWNNQPITVSAGERASTSYSERAKQLKDLGKDLLAETADMYVDISDLLTPGHRRVRSTPVVAQAGDTVEQYTPSPYDLPTIYGPPATTTTQSTS